MFTGIIEELGNIKTISANNITINCTKILEGTLIGDSISVNGVCLTVTNLEKDSFSANISPQTREVTNLSELANGDIVNLERALTLSSRLGGHIVSGHIDTVGKIQNISKSGDFYRLTFSFDKKYSKNVVEKGSIAVNGISLTIAECGNDFVTIAVIPHTYDMTTLKHLKSGDNVNLEFDILSKYVEKFLSTGDNNNITVNFLAENGFC